MESYAVSHFTRSRTDDYRPTFVLQGLRILFEIIVRVGIETWHSRFSKVGIVIEAHGWNTFEYKGTHDESLLQVSRDIRRHTNSQIEWLKRLCVGGIQEVVVTSSTWSSSNACSVRSEVNRGDHAKPNAGRLFPLAEARPLGPADLASSARVFGSRAHSFEICEWSLCAYCVDSYPDPFATTLRKCPCVSSRYFMPR